VVWGQVRDGVVWGQVRAWFGDRSDVSPSSIVLVLVVVLIVHPKLFIEPGTKAFFQLSSVSGPGL
jgi:hypothetical protein